MTYEEAEKLALRAIHGETGRGMIGASRNHLHQRVARAIMAASATAQPAAFDEGRERGAFESEFGSKPADSLAGLIWAGQIQGYLARARKGG